MGSPGILAAPDRLGRYELLARLASGGMGEIFLARLEGAEGFEKLFVVKRILPHLADDARFRQMLIAEARIASKLSHANICQVYELGETAGQLYIVMEYLEGVTLLPVLRRASRQGTPLELGLIGGVLQQACEALHYAHELRDRGELLGLVHRDVTPGNVFLSESGVVKLLDFGIAKARGASAQTQDGAVKGKYAYMAPEQLRGGEIDRRVDLFALGIVVYEMLALRRLFQRKTDYLTFRAVMEQPIPDVRRYRPDTPEPLARAVARALDRDPAGRYDTARQLGAGILDALAGAARPWTQGEVGDYVRYHFADDIARRGQDVAAALGRTQAGVAPRTLATSAPPDAEPDPADDDEFPSVETDVDPAAPLPAAPLPLPAPPRAASEPGDFIVGTPPPFGAEITPSSHVQPLRTAPEPRPAAAPRRGLLWPMVAVASFLIAGGALFLVWQQMQRQDQPRQPIVIEQQAQPAPAQAAPAPAPAAPAPAAPVPGPMPNPVPHPAPHARTTAPRVDPYNAALHAKLAGVNRCLVEHQQADVPTGATILIGTSGRPRTVSILPSKVASTPLGACLIDLLMNTEFPPARDEKLIRFPFVKT